MNTARYHKVWALAGVLLAAAPEASAANPLDTWNMIQPGIGSNGLYRLVWGDGRWLAVSGDGLLTSTNSVDWRGVSLSRDFGLRAFAYANGQWIGVGGSFGEAICGGVRFYSGSVPFCGRTEFVTLDDPHRRILVSPSPAGNTFWRARAR